MEKIIRPCGEILNVCELQSCTRTHDFQTAWFFYNQNCVLREFSSVLESHAFPASYFFIVLSRQSPPYSILLS